MSKKQEKIDEVYITSSNFGQTFVQCSGDIVRAHYTKEWFARQIDLHKIMQMIQKKYPSTPILLHDGGYLMFADGNDELAKEINAMFELMVMMYERKQKSL
jgi:hypothetical protein